MRRYYENHWIAKALLMFSTCNTITIGAFVFSKRDLTQRAKNHETIHSIQWVEVTMVAGLNLLLFGFKPILSVFAYYVLYILEWLIKMIIYRDSKKAYKAISFEREAYENQEDNNYIENRHLFSGWLKRIV